MFGSNNHTELPDVEEVAAGVDEHDEDNYTEDYVDQDEAANGGQEGLYYLGEIDENTHKVKPMKFLLKSRTKIDDGMSFLLNLKS